MKKIFSSILAVAMMLSMFTAFTAHAADLSASYEVAYVDESGNAVDLTTLKADDIFTAQVTIKNAADLQTAALTLNWDSSVVVPCKADGSAYTKFNDAVAWRMHTKIKNEDDENVYSAVKSEITDASVRYEIYTTADSDLLSGDKKFMTVRFRVVKTGNANIVAANAKMMEDGMSESAVANCTIPASVIGSTVVAPTTETRYYESVAKIAGANAKGYCFEVNNGTETATTKTFDFATDVVTAEGVTVGLTINEVPEDIVLTVIAKMVF